ncbi:cyclic AMP-dependent transcription factor ATF-4-like isoform X1 [Salvelinus namaycush]|uniref:Cyclic AMP-dependent transcription factor ATF-4 n=1 Tax=Salvelinus namaycush TaxID=8040 RepID=A0A8U0Q524_SALNM|nr:cyclic AMP-dependent transcription factor ATF-4-like isoform X1 [Salvelinus namaycush]
MTMMSSQFGLDDMEALLRGPSSLMADPMGSLLYHDEVTLIEGGASPLSSSSPILLLSPPSPPSLLLQEEKAEAYLLSFPWLSADVLGHTHHIGADNGKEDAFSGMDWMAKKVDLSEFDLDSLICSCSPDGSPSSPEDLIPSFECPMELDSLPLPTLPTPTDLPTTTDPLLPPTVSQPQEDPQEEVHSPPPCVPDAQEELEIKSEPQSPAPSLLPSPTFTLKLGSEVDASASVSEKLLHLEVPQPVPSIVLSLSPTRIVVLLAPKHEVGVTTPTVTIPEILSSDSDGSLSSSGQLNWPSIATTQSRFQNRRNPYPTTPKSRPQHPDQPSPTTTSTGGPPKEKKLKKMAQNKTAATRYRQKKKTAQEDLSAECDKLEQRNHKLAEKADSIANGIQYLKDLMEEVRQATSKKGLRDL